MQRTMDSFLGSLPVSMSFLAQATVTPPAVSAKMPSVSESRRMPATISSSVTSSQAPPVALMRSFRALVEQHAQEHWSVGDYARALSVTRSRLNAVCQRLAGRSPLQIAHDRLMLEARRNLIHTSMSIGEISYALGFREPAYFCRFFTRNEGRPPSAYRLARERAA